MKIYRTKNTYIERKINITFFFLFYRLPHRKGQQDPKFPLEMWNSYASALKSMPKTNSVEGWHTGFKATLDRVHPNIFKFVKALHCEQNLIEANPEQVIAGNPLPKNKKYGQR